MAPLVRGYGALTPPSPHGVRAAVGRVLRIGVLASGTLLVAGYLVGFFADSATFVSSSSERAHLSGRAGFPHSFAAVGQGIVRGNGEAIIVAGVLLLILTPVAGLLTSAVAFARRRDFVFTAISATVLVVILGSFVIGWLTS
jgi:uncharacterized membrane protein